MEKFSPPPKRNVASAPSTRGSTPEPAPGWRGKLSARSKVWGHKAMDTAVVVSDNVGGRVNTFAEKRLGTEAFWPTSGDFPKEMDKAARILRAFTEDGVVTTDKKKKRKVLRKVPPSVIASAKGLAIFTSMRSGIMPLGGAGGAGVVVAKLPDGTWSAPASISPNNFSAGFLLGVDIYDCILVIRTQAALDSFGTHKFTLGSEIAVTAGPWGAGAAVEAGTEKAPVFSYVKSRGLWAGVEVVGQVFVERFDENGNMYHWPGVKAKDILAGKVQVPREAAALQEALRDAESGRAQARTVGGALEAPLDANGNPEPVMPDDVVDLQEGEVLKLPPTPDMTDGHECESDPETETVMRRSGSIPPALPARRPVTAPPLPPRRDAPPSYETLDAPPDLLRRTSSISIYSDTEYDAPEGPPPNRTEPALARPNIPAPLDTAPPVPKRSEKRISAESPLTPSSPPVVTPVTPMTAKRVGTPELVALGAPAEMDESERREWEQFAIDSSKKESVQQESLL